MSSSIWTRCAGASRLRPLDLSPWRVVEAQHQVSTRKLVDSAAEQELLEELIDRAKPPYATQAPPRLHYLLATPFRYPPLRHGSRFGRRHERGIWYGSETRRAAFAEVAYYRLLFLEGTSAPLDLVETQLTAFTVRARSPRGIDLNLPPFEGYKRAIASPAKYDATQPLGSAMRDAAIELFRFPSAREPGGINIGVFDPSVFGNSKPRGFETWHCTATRSQVELAKRDFSSWTREMFSFQRQAFLVNGALPAPGLAS
ncbi:MAG TPA: RES family NAD+ phosphorylase [Gemmatimonadaceae bacterium]